MNKKKSIDGFVPSKKNVKTHTTSATARTGRGIPASELVEDDEKSIKGIVPLPAPNGNDLKIKGYDDFVSARGGGAKGSKKPTYTVEDFLVDSEDEGSGVDFDKPMSRNRNGLLPDYEGNDSDDDPGVAEDETEQERPAKQRSKLLFWQKDVDEDEQLGDSEGSEEDDFDIYNERPKQKRAKVMDAVKERKQTNDYSAVDDEDDPDNDLGVDEDDIENYRSRRFKREGRAEFQDESNVVLRVIGGAVIVVVTIIVTYFLFVLFYDAPEPAKIDDTNIVENTSKPEEQKPEEKPVEVPEDAPTVAVYNATTTAGLAASLKDSLATNGVDAVVGTSNGGNTVLVGSGYAILDFTGGKKPKGLAEIKQLLGEAVEVIEITDVANLPADVQTDRDFVVIIR